MIEVAKEEEYKRRVQSLDLGGLRELWDKILQRNTLRWKQGKALEYLIIRAFEIGGAKVSYPYSVFDRSGSELEQLDGCVHLPSLSCLIECKDFENDKVDFAPLAKMRSQLLRRPAATIGCIFSTSGFTEPAVTLASHVAPQTILLWEQSEVEFVLGREGLICESLLSKYQYYIEKCVPDFNTRIR